MAERAVALAAWLLGPLWIGAMRIRYGRGARALSPAERGAMDGHFSSALLGRVRVAEVEHIELWICRGLGRRAQAFATRRGGRVAVSPLGLTLDDLVLIVSGTAAWEPLLFHELVHVAQFGTLGRRRFAARYLLGWWRGGRHVGRIAMERDAYELQARFERGEMFDAEREVAERLATREM